MEQNNLGIIYKIINDINDKVYIGQTRQLLSRRWAKHLSDSLTKDTHLYRAMQKYGVDHFQIIPVEENIPVELLNEREQYWIQEFNSFKEGYNSTIGGDCGSFPSTPVYQYSMTGEFIAKYESANEAERITNCLHQNILKVCKGILRQCDGYLWSFDQVDHLEIRPSKRERKVAQYDENHNLIKIWDRVKDAAASVHVEPTHITRACRTQYKCHSYYWNYID